MSEITSTLFFEKHDGILHLTRRGVQCSVYHDVPTRTAYIPLYIWNLCRSALLDVGETETDGDRFLFTEDNWRISVFRFSEKVFVCFSKLNARNERNPELSMNFSKEEYNKICLVLRGQKLVKLPATTQEEEGEVEEEEDKGTTGVPVYGWQYVDAKHDVQMDSCTRFLKLENCVEHGMNAETRLPFMGNDTVEMKVYVDSVLYPDLETLLSAVYIHLLKMEFRMRLKGECCAHKECFAHLIAKHAQAAHLRISTQKLVQAAQTVSSLLI